MKNSDIENKFNRLYSDKDSAGKQNRNDVLKENTSGDWDMNSVENRHENRRSGSSTPETPKNDSSQNRERDSNRRQDEHGRGESARENDGKVDGHSSRKTPSDDMGYEDQMNEKEESRSKESADRDAALQKNREEEKNKREQAKVRDMNSSRREPDMENQNRE